MAGRRCRRVVVAVGVDDLGGVGVGVVAGAHLLSTWSPVNGRGIAAGSVGGVDDGCRPTPSKVLLVPGPPAGAVAMTSPRSSR